MLQPEINPYEIICATLSETWNTKNSAAWASCFSAPCAYVDALGSYHAQLEPEQNAALHDRGWSTKYRTSTASFRFLDARPLADEVALVHVEAVVDYEEQGQPQTTRNSISMIVERGLITQFHNTPQRPLPPGLRPNASAGR